MLPPAALQPTTLPAQLKSSCAAASRIVATVQPLKTRGFQVETPAPAAGFTSTGLAAALAGIETARDGTVGDLLRPTLSQFVALQGACLALEAGRLPSAVEFTSLREVVATGPLTWLAVLFEQLTETQPLGRLSLQAKFAEAKAQPAAPQPQAAPATVPSASVAPSAPPQSLADVVLDEAKRAALRRVLREIHPQLCAGQSAIYLSHLCGALTSLPAQPSVDSFAGTLQQAALADLRELPERALVHNARHDDQTAVVWLTLVYVREVTAGRSAPEALRGLAAVQCTGSAAPLCQTTVVQELRRAGALVKAIEEQHDWLTAASQPGSKDFHYLTAAILITWYDSPAVRAGAASAPTPSAADVAVVSQAVGLVQNLYQDQSTALLPRLHAGLSWLASYLRARLPAQADAAAQRIALVQGAAAAWSQRDPLATVAATMALIDQGQLPLPPPVRAVLPFIQQLVQRQGSLNVIDLLVAAPGVTQEAAQQLLGRAPGRGHDPFLDAPDRRPDDATRDKPPIANYLAGIRAAYVYQYWKPADIPDVNYQTFGLNLLRLELLGNFDRLPALAWLQSYLKYEFAPGGDSTQDELIELMAAEESGWQSFVADLATDFPFLGDDSSERGPVFGFKKRYFLVSAQALKDYWYYSDGGVDLLVPGDRIRTNTVMTTMKLGFRSTQIHGEHPLWAVEGGAYYLDYRKPYTHSRVTAVARSAIFAATFEGYGGYLDGRWYIAGQDQLVPITLSGGLKFGYANIELDDIAATSALPGDAGIYMVEAMAEVDVPVVWFGGFYFGGNSHVIYRSFGDYFSGGEPDPSRANDQNLNDDFIAGLSVQAGYFF